MATESCIAAESEVQFFQLTLECLELGNALLGVGKFVGNGMAETGKVSGGVTWLLHQLSDLPKGQPEGLGPLDEPQSSEGFCSIEPIARLGTGGRGLNNPCSS